MEPHVLGAYLIVASPHLSTFWPFNLQLCYDEKASFKTARAFVLARLLLLEFPKIVSPSSISEQLPDVVFLI